MVEVAHGDGYRSVAFKAIQGINWMTMILQADDAVQWAYRGEGAVNLVLAYCGDSPDFVGKVLRIHKVPNNEAEGENGDAVLTEHEHLLWEGYKGIVSALTREAAEPYYVREVICPLLGSEHVDAGISVLVSREFLEAIEVNVLCQRPAWRVDAAKVNPLCDSVLLMADHSIFPQVSGVLKKDFCVSVEIKPKAGFLPTSEFIDEENAIKKTTTRFKMHQTLKLRQKKISQISKYNPLDLFSGTKDGVRRAIKSLFLIPQNNFRVFLNGSLVFGGMGNAGDTVSCRVDQVFDEGLKRVISAKDGMHTNYFLELVAEAVFKSGLLGRLLEVQKLDSIDIEGAIHAYYDVISEPCKVCLEKGRSRSEKYASLHSMPREESFKIVRDYLISATSKDLSMIVSFRPRVNTDVGSAQDVVFLKPTNQFFDFKASFIDLDMKPLKKMEYYYELDQKILRCYLQMLKDEKSAVDNGEP